MEEEKEEDSDVTVSVDLLVELHERMVMIRSESAELPPCLSDVPVDECDPLCNTINVFPPSQLNRELPYASESVLQGVCSPPHSADEDSTDGST